MDNATMVRRNSILIAAALLVFGLVAVVRVNPQWLLGRQPPEAPPLPPGATLVEQVGGSDTDGGWVGVRGSAFTTHRTFTSVAAFYSVEFPPSQGWAELRPKDRGDVGASSPTHCLWRRSGEEGYWESVLLLAGRASPDRYLVVRTELGVDIVPEDKAPSMRHCWYGLGWVSPSSRLDWVASPRLATTSRPWATIAPYATVQQAHGGPSLPG